MKRLFFLIFLFSNPALAEEYTIYTTQRPPFSWSGVIDDEGNVQKWNLIDRWQLGDIKLPLLDGVGGVAGSLRDLLISRAAWKNLHAIVTNRYEVFKLYSLRHGYSVRGTSRKIDSGSMADSMGNNERTFLDSYQSSSKQTRRVAFEQAAKLLGVKQ